MPTISSAVTVERPPDAVFAYLVVPANQVEWSPNFQALIDSSPEPYALGTRFHGKLKNFGSLEFVYDEFQSPHRFRMATDHRTGHMTHRFTLYDVDGNTRVEHEVGFEPRGLARLATPLMVPMLRRMVADLDRRLETSLSTLG